MIDLTNPTANNMVLDPCPSYQQGIGEGGKDPLEFNCPAVHLLPAHQTQRFAMELAVPADYPTGQAEVYWNVAATTDVSARGSVEVIGVDTPCVSNQLTAAITGPGTVPGPPNMMGLKGYATAVPLTLTNRSNATCSVRGTPTVDLRTANGKELGLGQADERAIAMAPTVTPAPTVVLAPRDVATTTLYWYSDFCGRDPNPLTVTMTLPTNGATVEATPVGGWRPPPCPDGPPGHGQVGADPLQPG